MLLKNGAKKLLASDLLFGVNRMTMGSLAPWSKMGDYSKREMPLAVMLNIAREKWDFCYIHSSLIVVLEVVKIGLRKVHSWGLLKMVARRSGRFPSQ